MSCRDQRDKVLCPAVWRNSRQESLGEKENDVIGLFMEWNRSNASMAAASNTLSPFGASNSRASTTGGRTFAGPAPLPDTGQYPLARRTTVQWVARACQGVGRAYKRLDIVMTGHLLGGGLAQGAAYAVERALAPKLVALDGEEERNAQTVLAACPQDKVRVRAVVFDPSQVTSYRDGQPIVECENPRSERCRQPIVMRVYQKGEALAWPRHILSWFNPLDPNLCEDRCDLDRTYRLPVTQHQMRRIAGGLLWMARGSGDKPAEEVYDRYCPQDGGEGTGRLVCIPRKYECPLTDPDRDRPRRVAESQPCRVASPTTTGA